MKRKLIIGFILFLLVFSLMSNYFVEGDSSDQIDLSVKLDKPTKDTVWTSGINQNISWNLKSEIDDNVINYTLKYIFNGSGPYLIKKNISGLSRNYKWNIPDLESGWIKIIIIANAGGYKAWDDVEFCLDSISPEIESVYPEEGGLMPRDAKPVITFSEDIVKEDIENNITFFHDGQKINCSFDWDKNSVYIEPIVELALNGSYRIEIMGYIRDKSLPGNKKRVDRSINFTVIAESPDIISISELTNKKFRVGDKVKISWVVEGEQIQSNPVRLYFSINSGKDWKLIKDNLPKDGDYYWEIPENPFTEFPIKNVLLNISCLNIFDSESSYIDGPFEIYENLKPEVHIEGPNEGRYLIKGDSYNIKWTCVDDITLPEKPVSLSLSRDGGLSWEAIAVNVENDGEYTWNVNGQSSKDVILNVSCSDSDGDSMWSHSPPFSIVNQPPIEMTLVNSNDTIYPEENIKINWTLTKNIDEFKKIIVQFSGDGSHWRNVGKVIDVDSKISFKAPFEMSSHCQVRFRVFGNSGFLFEKCCDDFNIMPKVIKTYVDKKDGYQKVTIMFDTDVTRWMMERSFTMYKDDVKLDIGINDIYWQNETTLIFINDKQQSGIYHIELNSTGIGSRDFESIELLRYEIKKEEDIITFWPLLLLIPIALVLIYLLKDKNKKEKISKDRITIEK